MSGHSHWSNIKRKKEIRDKRRSKEFSRLSKMIMTAVKEGGKDPEMNSSLKLAIEKAKESDMPKENIEKAIKKGMGEGEEGSLENFTLEIYGPEGLAVIIKGTTDNKNRTLSQINQILKTSGGKMAKPGSVKWLFDKKGVIEIPKSEENELIAIDAGAEAIDYKEDTMLVYTSPENLNQVKNNLKKKVEIEDYDLGFKPKITPSREKHESFLDALEENEEVEQVYFTIK